ncbi:MAG: AraC family transcriptional regulator [Chitinophagaceae bacterium]
MATTHLYIKNMCCNRCIEVVGKLLKSARYKPVSVIVGEVVIAKNLTPNDIHKINEQLHTRGFDIADKNNDKIVIRIQALLFRYLNEVSGKDGKHKKLSTYLAEMMQRNYHHLSHVFSTDSAMTIEKYYIRLKIEKAKELIINDELSLSDIAYELGYSSQQTFSTQFKKQTGKTPGEYKIDPLPARVHRDKLVSQNLKQHSYAKKHTKD